MRFRPLVVLALVAGLLPGTASAGVELVTRDEQLAPLGRELSSLTRTLAPVPVPSRFNLVGLHWRGDGKVWFRTRAATGGWSAWNDGMPEPEDQPDGGSAEDERANGWRLGNPWWTGPADWIQYRLDGEVTRLRAHFMWSPATTVRAPSAAGMPSIIPRAAWGADESIVRDPPLYAQDLRLAIVHHTAGGNDYSPAESAAIVRAIEVYHVKANGWNDIGYNFLVDKYGQVFEGRAGGVDENVVGAHTRGFNTGSVGVALLGTHGSQPITSEAEQALASLLAWRLDVAHVDPLSTVAFVSGGNERFVAGTAVSLRAISGHRDAGSTACPGSALYAELDPLAAEAAGIGLPKLYGPAATPHRLVVQADGSYVPVLFTARVSDSRPWSITVTDEPTGAVLAIGSGSGTSVSWSWDGRGFDGLPVDPAGTYVATIAAEGARPATVRLSAQPASSDDTPPAGVDVTDLALAPAAVTPNGDGKGDTAKISFTLAAPASVTVYLQDEAGSTVTTLMPSSQLQAGTSEVRWDGSTQTGEPVADGRYEVVVAASSAGQTVARSAPVLVDRTLGGLLVSPRRLSPNGDDRKDVLSVGFGLAREADVLVTIRSGSNVVVTLFEGLLLPGSQHFSWNGAVPAGVLADGAYVATVEATTPLGTRRLGASVVVDQRPPTLGVLSATTRRGTTTVRLVLSERARVRVWAGDSVLVFDRSAGASTVSVPGAARRLRLRAFDTAGNASRAVKVSPRR